MNAPGMRIPGGEAVDDEGPDSQHHHRSRSREWAHAALTRLGLAVMTAVFCMLLVFGIGWAAAALW